MTYRERREARAERLRGWADKREQQSAAELEKSHRVLDQIPFGQPILVGHHSERADRRRREGAWDALGRSAESARKAESMSSRADEIDRQAERAIYSDDPDALERLEARIAELETKRETMKARNAAYRKQHAAELGELTPYQRSQQTPHASYELTNLGGNIGRLRKRLEQMRREKVNGPRDRIISARYSGECAACGAAIERGAMIRYSRAAGARCAECPTGGEGR